MSDLTFLEKQNLEKIYDMSEGFVLKFSNRTFREFVLDGIGKDIYDIKYETNGESKANRLRLFWQLESNHVVGKLTKDLLDYAPEVKTDIDPILFEKCRRIADRLLQATSSEIELHSEKDFKVLTDSIKESIDKNNPETGLDRLHTYATKYLRSICRKRGINTENKSLQSLIGEYVKHLNNKGEIESEITNRILKSAVSVFDSFNDIRNNRSLAHDNPVLNKDESMLILKHIISTLAFIKSVERKKMENFKIEKDFPDKLRSSILVSEVVGKKVKLKLRGKEFVGLCPFHSEKSPSFIVNDQKGFYHCFGCAAHGDIVNFLMSAESLNYKDAIIKLVTDFDVPF